MKKITLSAIVIISSVISLQAQLYTPTGTILGNSLNNNIGIGTNSPAEKTTIHGNHVDTRLLLHSTGGGNDTNEADLMLWASEPGLTHQGVGIGNNIHTYKNNIGAISLLNPARGGSYIRLLDNSMLFNVVSSSGVDKQALSINSEGNVGIGDNHGIKLSVGNSGWVNKSIIQTGYNTLIGDYTEINVPGYIANGASIRIAQGGNVGIGTQNPDSKLTVAGNIHAQEVKVTVNAGADFVFENDYNLPSLTSVETFIKENKHLPEIASAKAMQENGINLSEMNIKLLQKIEELTLYSIAQEKKINTQAQEIETLKDLVLRVAKIENELIHRN